MSKVPCPTCDGVMDRNSNRCAACSGYGSGRSVRPDGYVRIWAPGHPVAYSDGYALEHRYVLHEAGIALPDGHHVHHLNGDPGDNRVENLAVLAPKRHLGKHYEKRRQARWPHLEAGTHCIHGHELTDENTYVNKRGGRVCRICRRRCQRDYRDRMKQ